MTEPIEVDGAMGEGGGQVLRSALSLSLLTGRPFRLVTHPSQPRPTRTASPAPGGGAGRGPGVRRRVSGDRVGSEEIEFAPGPVRPGDYFFDIGTAGATSLVLQTLLLPLALAPGDSSVTIHGGTHVPWSPCFHYLDWQWRPFLARIGIPFDLTMTMAGFYPQGGGGAAGQDSRRCPPAAAATDRARGRCAPSAGCPRSPTCRGRSPSGSAARPCAGCGPCCPRWRPR